MHSYRHCVETNRGFKNNCEFYRTDLCAAAAEQLKEAQTISTKGRNPAQMRDDEELKDDGYIFGSPAVA